MIIILILVIMLLITFVIIACKKSSEIYIDIICAVLIILSITGLIICIPTIVIEQCNTCLLYTSLLVKFGMALETFLKF